MLLPHKKVTPQQLSQPLGSGATVFEIPGVFDDCMKVVEALADNYTVALLNSKNAWRVLGQESYAYEIAQDFEYEMADKAVVVPVGNAGNITAYWKGFVEYHQLGKAAQKPVMMGFQAEGAAPIVRGYVIEEPHTIATAIRIGNPASWQQAVTARDESGGIIDME